MSVDTEELDSLKTEISELYGKLKAAEAAQTQAAELGLDLLKQRSELEQQIESLQKEFDITKLELIRTKKTLVQFRDQHKIATDSELDHEQSLLEDSAKLEAEYGTKIVALETEVKCLHEQLNLYKSEAERLQTYYSSNEDRLNQLESERKQLREELKDLRAHEQTLQYENNELEEENVTLQKQVSNLKAAQVEFEVMRMEIARLIEETVLLQASADEANNLRSLAEKQEQEALAHAQQEREQRLWLKKEYERLHNDQHLSTLNHLIFGINNNNETGDGSGCGSRESGDSDTLKQLESSIISDTPFGAATSPFKSGGCGGGQDLFSEIQGGLSDKVAELELEKEELTSKVTSLNKSILQAMSPLAGKLAIDVKEDDEPGAKIKMLVEKTLERLGEGGVAAAPNAEEKYLLDQLRSNLRQTILLAGWKDARLNAAHDQILVLAHALHQFYAEIAGGDESAERRRKVSDVMMRLRAMSEANIECETGKPNDKVDDSNSNVSDVSSSGTDAESIRASPLRPSNLPRLIISEGFRRELETKLSTSGNHTKSFAKSSQLIDHLLSENDLRGRLMQVVDDVLEREFESINELVRLVRSAAETTVQSKMAMEDKDKADLYQANTKLKSLLAVKREQVSSLRVVLRSNKTSTENALQCLRDKYESEKKLKDEAMESLRRELKQFKEDAATFASHRAMFTARCEELQGQLESAQESLKSTEEEKRTLNQLLRMAIHQKIELTQRVEHMEMDREIQAQHLTQQIPTTAQQQQQQQKRPNLRAPGSVGLGGGAPSGPRQHGGVGMRGSGEMTRTVRYPQSGASSANNGAASCGSRSAR